MFVVSLQTCIAHVFYCRCIPTGSHKWINQKASLGDLMSPFITYMTFFLYSKRLLSLYVSLSCCASYLLTPASVDVYRLTNASL